MLKGRDFLNNLKLDGFYQYIIDNTLKTITCIVQCDIVWIKMATINDKPWDIHTHEVGEAQEIPVDIVGDYPTYRKVK